MSAFDVQVGGTHYKGAIQPIEFILANDLGFVEGTVIKYVYRWKDKGGVEDLEKAIHYLQMLIEAQKTVHEDFSFPVTSEDYTVQKEELETTD